MGILGWLFGSDEVDINVDMRGCGDLRPGAKGTLNGEPAQIIDLDKGRYVVQDIRGHNEIILGNGLSPDGQSEFKPYTTKNRGLG